MTETIIGVAIIILIVVVGISVSQISGRLKKIIYLLEEILSQMEPQESVDRFDPQTGKPIDR